MGHICLACLHVILSSNRNLTCRHHTSDVVDGIYYRRLNSYCYLSIYLETLSYTSPHNESTFFVISRQGFSILCGQMACRYQSLTCILIEHLCLASHNSCLPVTLTPLGDIHFTGELGIPSTSGEIGMSKPLHTYVIQHTYKILLEVIHLGLHTLVDMVLLRIYSTTTMSLRPVVSCHSSHQS